MLQRILFLMFILLSCGEEGQWVQNITVENLTTSNLTADIYTRSQKGSIDHRVYNVEANQTKRIKHGFSCTLQSDEDDQKGKKSWEFVIKLYRGEDKCFYLSQVQTTESCGLSDFSLSCDDTNCTVTGKLAGNVAESRQCNW